MYVPLCMSLGTYCGYKVCECLWKLSLALLSYLVNTQCFSRMSFAPGFLFIPLFLILVCWLLFWHSPPVMLFRVLSHPTPDVRYDLCALQQPLLWWCLMCQWICNCFIVGTSEKSIQRWLESKCFFCFFLSSYKHVTDFICPPVNMKLWPLLTLTFFDLIYSCTAWISTV